MMLFRFYPIQIKNKFMTKNFNIIIKTIKNKMIFGQFNKICNQD